MRGRRGAFGTFIDVRGSLVTTVDPWTPTVFDVAGVTLSAPEARFAWQAWRVRYLHRCPRKLGDDGGPMDTRFQSQQGSELLSLFATVLVLMLPCMVYAVAGVR